MNRKPQFASSLLNMTVAPGFPRLLAEDESPSQCSGRKSTQILTSADLLGTTTMPAHQSVGVCTFVMTPFYLTPLALSFEEAEAHCEEQIEKMVWHWVSTLSSIPKLLKRDGYWSNIDCVTECKL